jgi:dockerin type I repeat protein
VWQDDKFDSGGEINGQRYSGNGAPLGTEFRVNTYGAGGQFYPSVAADSAGDFLVAWQSEGQYGVSNPIQARRFAGSGAPLGSEFRVDTTVGGLGQLRPKVASDEAGNFTVAWQLAGTVLARRFLPTGAPLAAPFTPPTSTVFSQGRPAVANAGTAFVVAWGILTSADRDIFAKRYPGQGDVNADGATDVLDVFYLINFLFAAGPDPIGFADTNGDGNVDVLDVFYLVNYLFAGGPLPK